MIKEAQCTISDDLVVLPQLSTYKQFASNIIIEESNVLDLSLLKNIASDSDFTLPSSLDLSLYRNYDLSEHDDLFLSEMDDLTLEELDRVLV
jgi:hypothetical protein